MRSFWLASAATLFLAGAACAQTSTPGPAPTGAPNSPVVTAPGASPGNTGTSSTASSTGQSLPSGAMSNSGGPANNASGAPSGATVTTPGKSSGKTMSSGASSTTGEYSSASTSSAMPAMHHHYRSGRAAMFMPENAPPDTYLHIAKMAVMHHNKAMAEEALNRAETQMLNRSVPEGGIAADTSPGIMSIENARTAVQSGRMKEAVAAIDTAMQQAGMASDESSAMSPSPMPAPQTGSTHSTAPMNPKTFEHSSSSSGFAPSAGSTSDSAAADGGSIGTNLKNPDKPASNQ